MQVLDQTQLDILLRLILLFFSIIIIFIVYKILMWLIERALQANRKVSYDDISNGLRVIVRMGAGLAFLYAIMILFDISPTVQLGIATLIGSVVSFSSIQAIQNFVAGLFILFTSPYGIADFVSISGQEGIVSEISLNYTKLRTIDNNFVYIPNKNVINAVIINYNKKVKPKQDKNTRLTDLSFFKTLLKSEEVVRYSFQWGAPLGDLEETKQKIQAVCKKYSPIFGYLPEFFLYTISHRMEFIFIVLSDEAEIVLNELTNFRDEIVAQFH